MTEFALADRLQKSATRLAYTSSPAGPTPHHRLIDTTKPRDLARPSLAPCSRPSRTLRAASRCAKQRILDSHSARRTRESQAGTKKTARPAELRNTRWGRLTAPPLPDANTSPHTNRLQRSCHSYKN